MAAKAAGTPSPRREDYGGQGLLPLLNAGCTEMWNAANMAFAVCPLLDHGAIEALEAHG